MVAANNQSFWYTATNRLQNAGGPWGDLTFYSDGVGNRTYRILNDGATTTTQTFGYPALTNLIGDEDTGGVTTRTFTHDAAGNMTRDVRSATTYDYVINNAGRISQVKINTVVKADYEYNAQNQLVLRSTTVAGGPSGDVHLIYDRAGHLIAEADAATGTTFREYVWLADMPIAVVADVDTASPIIYYVHVDHLNRPVMMTDGLKANVWEAVWLPYGAAHAITGAAANDARFPGQWFQIETGLHYNWHRHYDPTLARYTQADPLGFVDGPSLFAYALNSPQVYVDPDGRFGLATPWSPWLRPWPKRPKANSCPVPPGVQPNEMTGLPNLSGEGVDCDKLLSDDTATCNAITRRRGGAAGARCHASATQRFAACLRGQPLPPLDTWNN